MRNEVNMEEPIRVLHVLQRMEAAGVQTLLMSIYRNVDRTKIQFDFLVHYKEDQFFDKEIESLGGHVYKLSVREDHNLPKYLRELSIFFKEHPEYKIVHGHMPILGYFYLHVAYKAGVPVRIAHAHTDRHYNNLKGYIATLMKSLYPIYANNYFACSDSAGRYFFKGRKYTVVKNAIMTEKFAYSEEVRKNIRSGLNLEGKFVIGHAARFAEHKNHTFLIDVFAEVLKIRPDSVLLLIGDGELKTGIQNKVNGLGIGEHVRFMGVRPDVNELYQAMDAFVFPSIFEGLGIVNIEAQASGVLTFCSDAVPNEANISPVFHSIPLTKSASEWAKIIVKTYENSTYRREDMSQYVIDGGYDIKDLATKLQHFYLDQEASH